MNEEARKAKLEKYADHIKFLEGHMVDDMADMFLEDQVAAEDTDIEPGCKGIWRD